MPSQGSSVPFGSFIICMVESKSIHEHIHAQPIITTHLTGWLICIVLELLRFPLRLQLVAPSRLRKRFFIAMARLWVRNVCARECHRAKGGISPMHPPNLTQCEFKRDHRIAAVVPGNQASRSRIIIQKEKGFGQHCQLYMN